MHARSPTLSPSQSPPTKRRAPAVNSSSRRSLSFQMPHSPARRSLSPPPPVYSDRFVPSRSSGDLSVEYSVAFNSLQREKAAAASPPSATKERDENMYARAAYEQVLRSEMFGGPEDSSSPPSLSKNAGPVSPLATSKRRLLQFSSDPRSPPRGQAGLASPYSMSALSEHSKTLLMSPQKTPRKIGKTPYKVLEAPAIQDDFYLNLIDWGPQNILGVGLGSSVYLWNAQTAAVSRMVDLGSDLVASLAWPERGSLLAVGTNGGECVVWDAAAGREVRSLKSHRNRVGTLCWNGSILTSGSRDRFIYHHDLRSPKPYVAKLAGHKQEVCGLQWSPDGQYLASGGNDNRLLVWSPHASTPVQKYTEHTAAVKAIAWSPHQRGLLASGGGTADRSIRFWNVLTGAPLHSVDTGSQVCNLAWSKNVNEIVSTHGYSQNQVVIWSYPSMSPLARLTGHLMRVLYLAVSPDGQTIVTGAGDETLRFWAVFPPSGSKEVSRSGMAANITIR